MSYIAYPKLCVSADGYIENPERGSTLHRAEDGTPWIVNLWPETRYTFDITHPALCAEEQLELERFYDQHIGDEVGWDNPRRQERWIVRMVGPPRLAGMRNGMRGDVEMTLVGYRGTVPTNPVPPAVSGLHQIGQVISVSQGTWQSEYPMQFEYQWLRNGEPIAGATGQNYTLVDDDLFDMISARVTASSLGGSTSVETDPVRARLDSAVSWLYSDIAETIFVDTSGNTPATWGDPVGLVKDSSGNGNDFTQPTVTARPILGRVPRGGRRNLLTWTEDLSNPVWLKGAALTVDYMGAGWWVVDKAEASGVYALRQLYGTVLYAGEVHSIEIELMAGSASSAHLGLYRGGFGISSARILSGPGHLVGSGITRVEGLSATEKTVLQVSRKFTSDDVGGDTGLYIYPVENLSSVIGSVKVRFPSVTRLEDLEELPPPYQKVTSQYDITESGVPDVHYLNFDGTDDLISTELPAISGGTLVLATDKGIWIDDDFSFDGGSFDIGPETYSGGPAGLLGVIGNPLVGGALVIDRQLTTAERAQVVEYMQSIGSPGLIELGPELLVNGDFSDGFDGWELIGAEPERWSVSDGVATIAVGDTHAAYLRQYNVTEGGLPHLITVDIVSSNGVGTIRAGGGTDNNHAFQLASHPVGEMSAVFVSGGSQPNFFQVYAAPITQASMSSVSFREVILP